jgi:hypothetical protein
MSDIVNDNNVRLAAMELIVSELLAHCVSTEPVWAAKILSDTNKARALSPSGSQDHAVFSLVAREFELAIERSQEISHHPRVGQA